VASLQAFCSQAVAEQRLQDFFERLFERRAESVIEATGA